MKLPKVSINEKYHEVYLGKKEVGLTPIEFKLLKLLMDRSREVLGREVLGAAIWPDKYSEIDPRTMDQHISRLRKKGFGHIVAVPCFGYKFKP